MAAQNLSLRRGCRAGIPVVALVLALPVEGRAGEQKDAPGYATLVGAEAEACLRTARAAWKTFHQHTFGLARIQDGRVEFDFRDSWKHDVAAYELDKLLGLGLVPPTVERRIDGRVGSLQLWIEGAMSDRDRRHKGLSPPDPAQWANRRAAIRFLRELAYDTDYNIQNTLIGPGFRVWAIDFSRAFRVTPQLPSPETLDRLSLATVERLRALDRSTVETRLGAWLDGVQIEGLMKRRERMLALADERGSARVDAGRGDQSVP